jgi:hypothetical protein
VLALPAGFLFFDARSKFRFPYAPLAILIGFGVCQGDVCLLVTLPEIGELFATRTELHIEG